MPQFSKDTRDAIMRVAQDYGIEPAALLAVADVESGGRAFTYLGGRKEPLIRFEGHYFDRLLGEADRVAARRAGLASPKAGAVKNPRGQADRWALLDRAARIDRAAALQSVSWGIGQVMGAHWKQLGFASVDALAREARSGVEGQVRLMVRFIRTNRLLAYLHARDWAGFARRYNGPAYARNRYDTRLAAAYDKHRQATPSRVPAVPSRREGFLKRGMRGPAVRDLQRILTAAGYPLAIDGVFGPKTEAALKSFQRAKGLVVDGIHGPRSTTALKAALPQGRSILAWLRAAWRRLTGR